MSQPTVVSMHPLLHAVQTIDAALDETTGVDPDWLPPQAKGDLLLDLARLCERINALRLRVLAGADDLAAETGARSAAAWLAHHTRVRPGRLVHDAALGASLAHTHLPTGQALAAGTITHAHAAAVVDSLDRLPNTVGPATRSCAEDLLIGYCAQFIPQEIRRLGRRILHVIDPALADEKDRKALEAQERRAQEHTRLTLTPLGDGRTRLAGEIPDLSAAILNRALDAYTNPRRPACTGEAGDPPQPAIPLTDAATGRKYTAAERRGHAFCALLEHLPTDGLPTTGGSPITVTVTIDFDKLRDDVGTATLDPDLDLTPAQARRMACHHGLLPIVLDGDSVPLDLGRSQRLFTHHQAKAHALSHPVCQAEGCTIPAAWCERHHRTSWARGGPTDLANLAFLCPHHHHRAHDPGYHHTWTGEAITYHRRT